jgi:hypothetical protein
LFSISFLRNGEATEQCGHPMPVKYVANLSSEVFSWAFTLLPRRSERKIVSINTVFLIMFFIFWDIYYHITYGY